MSLTSPLRNPDHRNTTVMTRRAWWLLTLTVFVPGSAQMLAGNRRFGRFLVGAWLSLLGLAVALFALFMLNRAWFLSLITSSWGLIAAQVVAIVAAATWFIAAGDTIRLVRFVNVAHNRRPWLAALAVFALLAPAGFASYAAVIANTSNATLGEVFADTIPVDPINGKYTFMLLGGDAGSNRIGLRPDSISFVSVDATTGEVTIVGIPRNLYDAPFSQGSPMLKDWPNGFNCGDNCLISFIYQWAEDNPGHYPDAVANGSSEGIEATRDAVEGVVGVPVQFYVIVDMRGFASMIDALGGIDIDVETQVDICTNGQPITESFEVGIHHMDGHQALKYARSRCNITDFQRMEHQRQIQEAVLRQFKPATVISRFQDLAAAGQSLVQTDVPQSMVGLFADLGAKARGLEITKLELAPPVIDNLYVDYPLVRDLVKKAMYPVKASSEPTE